MVEQMALALLGPFFDHMRGMLKEMLGRSDLPLYNLHKKIEIDAASELQAKRMNLA